MACIKFRFVSSPPIRREVLGNQGFSPTIPKHKLRRQERDEYPGSIIFSVMRQGIAQKVAIFTCCCYPMNFPFPIRPIRVRWMKKNYLKDFLYFFSFSIFSLSLSSRFLFGSSFNHLSIIIIVRSFVQSISTLGRLNSILYI